MVDSPNVECHYNQPELVGHVQLNSSTHPRTMSGSKPYFIKQRLRKPGSDKDGPSCTSMGFAAIAIVVAYGFTALHLACHSRTAAC
jgi:hypothetical protein